MTLGERIALVREQRGWTREQLGEHSGLHPMHIGQIERDERRPRPKTLAAISSALKVSSEFLLTGRDSTLDAEVIDYVGVMRLAKEHNIAPMRLQELILAALAIQT